MIEILVLKQLKYEGIIWWQNQIIIPQIIFQILY